MTSEEELGKIKFFLQVFFWNSKLLRLVGCISFSTEYARILSRMELELENSSHRINTINMLIIHCHLIYYEFKSNYLFALASASYQRLAIGGSGCLLLEIENIDFNEHLFVQNLLYSYTRKPLEV